MNGMRYEEDCCTKEDCIKAELISQTPWTFVTTRNGEEDRIEVTADWMKTYKERVRPSRDADYHICYKKYTGQDWPKPVYAVLCIYIPLSG